MFYDPKSPVRNPDHKAALRVIVSLLPVEEEVTVLLERCKTFVKNKGKFKPISCMAHDDRFHDMLLELKQILIIKPGWEFEVPQKGLTGVVKIRRQVNPAKQNQI